MTSQSAATIAFEGTIASTLRDTLAGQLNIAADAAKADCILFDGAAGGPTPERVQEIVDSGKTVIVLSPTADQLQQIGKIAGIGTTPSTPAVALSRGPKGNYCLNLFPDSKPASSKGGSDRPKVMASETRAPIPVGPRLAEALRTGNTMAAPDAESGLFPPGGAYFGWTTLQTFHSGMALVPSDCNENRDLFQRCTARLTHTFYVYWVNGGDPGYYVVILKQTGMFSSTPLNNDKGSRGFMQPCARHGMRVMLPQSPPNSYLTLLASSPSSGEMAASVSQIMELNVSAGAAGMQNLPFSAVDDASLNLVDWVVENELGIWDALWFFYETTPWNPSSDPDPGNGDWKDVFFDGDGNCVPFSPIAQSALSTTGYATWTVTNAGWTDPTHAPGRPPAFTLIGYPHWMHYGVLTWAASASWTSQPGWTLSIWENDPDEQLFNLELNKIATKVPIVPPLT